MQNMVKQTMAVKMIKAHHGVQKQKVEMNYLQEPLNGNHMGKLL